MHSSIKDMLSSERILMLKSFNFQENLAPDQPMHNVHTHAQFLFYKLKD